MVKYLDIYPHNFEKTHSGNFFLLAEEDAAVWILLVEDAACVLNDGTKQFGVTNGNLPPARV